MGISPFDPTDTSIYEIDYIPQRLAALEICVHVCYLVISGRLTSSEFDDRMVQVTSPKLSSIPICSPRQFIDLAIDSGLVANRTLLNFVGIKLDNGTLVEKSYALTVEKFGGGLVSLDDATNILVSVISADDLKDMWVEALTTASKSSAHFTELGAKVSIKRLGYACFATSLLIRKVFYKNQNRELPKTYLPEYAVPKKIGVWSNISDGSDIMC